MMVECLLLEPCSIQDVSSDDAMLALHTKDWFL